MSIPDIKRYAENIVDRVAELFNVINSVEEVQQNQLHFTEDVANLEELARCLAVLLTDEVVLNFDPNQAWASSSE